MAEAGKPRVDQIVGECFVKIAHIILSARICQPTRTAPKQGPKCWVRTCFWPAALYVSYWYAAGGRSRCSSTASSSTDAAVSSGLN